MDYKMVTFDVDPCLTEVTQNCIIIVSRILRAYFTGKYWFFFNDVAVFLGIHFLSPNIASAYFQLANLTIVLLSWPVLFPERRSWWQPSISPVSTSIPDTLQILITVFSKSPLHVMFSMPDNSSLFLQLYCSPFTWCFSKVIIFSLDLLFPFFVITSLLVSFLFSNEIWSIASVSLYIWLDSLCKAVTFPFRYNIFCTKHDIFSKFNAGSERFKILVLLSSILIISSDVSM